jgi:transposase
MDFSAYLGLDVHKIRSPSRTACVQVRHASSEKSATRRTRLRQMLRKLGNRYGRLHCVYESGPCGYGLYRQINDAGHVCEVVSPAHTPRRAGDHINTDRRDAVMLARLSRAGELTTVWVPDPAHEAMRDLIRSREIASKDVRQARQRI